ncbi:MAG: hypothetical protein U0939_03005 [Pirellulales bacterium]
MPLDISCPVVAWSHVQAPWSQFDAWRDELIARRNSPALSQICKLGDEQTVVSTEAIFRAIDAAGWHDRSFADWGVISAPQFLGRLRMAGAVDRYKTLEVRGTSPRIIPTLSQHAVAGSLSVVFKCQGPSFGVGGSQGSLGDALVNAASLVASGMCPGFWVTCSHWTPEVLPYVPPEQNAEAVCHALALAIVPAEGDAPQSAPFELSVRFQPTLAQDSSFAAIPDLAQFLVGSEASHEANAWNLALAPGLCAQVRRRSAAAATSKTKTA